MNEETPTPADNALCQATATNKYKATGKSKGNRQEQGLLTRARAIDKSKGY